ncbi:helix-turn-helix domain-containing protein [Agrilactobacillus yilanensis]|uniref:Helix-turn-helix domain-containing protein n=1 Tax=Agrilactobacillus yilanensis TaxID=2485997 RepID=A0ABW4J2A9_9LACO|nr:helix-turn-helix transcriptional regulator [Agrilactobacillus yilanensis]
MTTLDRVKKISKNRGWSLQKVAEKAGIGKNSIYRWSTKKPTTNSLQKVADVLDVSIDYLLGDTDRPEKNTGTAPKKIDLKDSLKNGEVIMAWGGKPIPPEELEMIRRILDGGK